MDQQNPFQEQEIDLREYARVLYERRWLIISFTIILCTLSLMRSFMMKPVYMASTRILIQKEAPNVLSMQEVSTSEAYTGRDYYQTQYKILKSRAIAEKVNKELGGYVPFSEWTGRKPVKDITDISRANALLGRVRITPIANTQLVSIGVEDIDPKLSAKITNLWAENYVSYILDTKFEVSRYASAWLQDKIKEAKSRLEDSEHKIQKYRKKHSLLADTDDEGILIDQLLGKKAELEIEFSEKKEYYREKHPEMIGLNSEMKSIDEKIKSEREKDLEAGEKSIEYNMLKREVSTNRDIYESLLKRVGETEVTGELKTTNINIVDKAIVPGSSARPKKKKNLLMALLMGILGGSGVAFLIEFLDQSVRTPEDVKNHLKLPVLASVAMPKDEEDKSVQPEFMSLERPRSTISESYRSLRTSILFTAVEHKRKTILVTSSGPQEGKTTTAINLAIIMAQAGEKTILLDADLRRPKIEKSFNISAKHGMTEVLAGTESIDSAIRKTDKNDLDIITCGSIPPNPSELLGTKKMDELLKELEARYDRIVIDSPPILAVTDSVVLSRKVDGVVLVVRANETNRNAALKSKEILATVATVNLIGVVLNMVDIARTGGHYYYYHYYGKKHGHYGADEKV